MLGVREPCHRREEDPNTPVCHGRREAIEATSYAVPRPRETIEAQGFELEGAPSGSSTQTCLSGDGKRTDVRPSRYRHGSQAPHGIRSTVPSAVKDAVPSSARCSNNRFRSPRGRICRHGQLQMIRKLLLGPHRPVLHMQQIHLPFCDDSAPLVHHDVALCNVRCGGQSGAIPRGSLFAGTGSP